MQPRSEDVDFPFSPLLLRRNYIARHIRVRGTKIDEAAFEIGDRGSVKRVQAQRSSPVHPPVFERSPDTCSLYFTVHGERFHTV